MHMPLRTTALNSKRRQPGLDVRPGSIKRARAEAGLTLAQVASGEISRTAVHLTEAGKTRPTMRTLKLIAARTGKPIDYFLVSARPTGGLGSASQVDRLRDLAAAERFEELRSAADEAKSEPLDDLDEGWVAFFWAQAQIRLANPSPALAELQRIRQTFQDADDHWMVVECMDWESAALHLLEDASALGVAQSALAACRRLKPSNRILEARILGRIGSIHVARHEWPEAIEHYRLAIEAADELKDLSRLGKMHSDLSGAYEHLGDFQRARLHGQKAINIHELLHDHLSIARAENNLGLVLMRQGDMDGARDHLNRSLRICEESGIELGKSHVLMSLAELELGGGDLDGARRHSEQAREVAAKSDEQGSLASAHQLLGQVAEALGKKARADKEFRMAISILEQAGLNQRLVTCLSAYAKLLEDRGDTAGSLQQMKRALAISRPDLETSVKAVITETA